MEDFLIKIIVNSLTHPLPLLSSSHFFLFPFKTLKNFMSVGMFPFSMVALPKLSAFGQLHFLPKRSMSSRLFPELTQQLSNLSASGSQITLLFHPRLSLLTDCLFGIPSGSILRAAQPLRAVEMEMEILSPLYGDKTDRML